MKHYCEIVAGKLFPLIKRMVAMQLREKYAFTQKEIAEKLDISQGRVSTYLKKGISEKEQECWGKTANFIAVRLAKGEDVGLCDVCKKLSKKELSNISDRKNLERECL